MTGLDALLVVAAIFALGTFYVMVPIAADVYRRFRGTRVVTCPENQRAAAVEVDARHAALTTVAGRADIKLAQCSRWPERHDCGQECLRQIEEAPEECLVRTMLAKFYAGKQCVLCGASFDGIESWGHHTGLMAPGGLTSEWREIASEQLPDVLQSHQPVCWNCHVAETFRRQHSDLVIDRPAQSAAH
jgi:hypothetical protein